MSARKPNDTRGSTEISEAAYETQNEEEYWRLIATLHGRGTKTEFLLARGLTGSADPIRREIGADILGQLGWAEQSFQDESVSLLIELLSDPTDDVIASAAFALGHRNSPEAVQALKKHLKHPNPRVRQGVAFGLSCLDDKSAVEGLIVLSEDRDYDVRNWATFGLGSQCDIDTADLREALKIRTEDREPEIRGEALIGLAKRKDSHVKEKIIRELSGEFFGGWAIEAAELYPDTAYIPLLSDLADRLGIEDRKYFSDNIESALAACRKT